MSILKIARGGTVAAALGLAAGCQTTPTTPLTWKLPDGVKTVEANGYPMAYAEKGSGPTVLLVHGANCDYRCSWTLMQALPGRYRVVSVSLRHHYPEPWDGSGTAYSETQHAKDLAAFAAKMSPPVDIVAHSYGGSVAVEMAREHPELVRKLVLAEAATDALLPSPSAEFLDGRKKYADTAESLLKTKGPNAAMEFGVDAFYGKGTYSRYPAVAQAVFRDNAWTLVAGARAPLTRGTCAEFGSLKMPVLLAMGENTDARHRQLIQAQQKCLPPAKTVVIPKTGHALIGQPAFAGAVDEFLK